MDDIHVEGSTCNGIQGTHLRLLVTLNHIAWAERGIVGRGVLIDYYSWSRENDPYDPISTHPIRLENVKKCIEAQNVAIQKGDILLVRSGFMNAYMKADAEGRFEITGTNPAHFAGIEQSKNMLKWIWESGFSAVAGDCPSFESWRTSY
jgi:Putative cyclase